jgi:DNA-binding transcriptional LysR family regulator
MPTDVADLFPAMALFASVARARSFSAAARQRKVPLSTVSRRIAELEQRLGVQLLLRNTRHVELTAAGAVYLERCTAVLEAAEAANTDIMAEHDVPRGTLRVSTTPDVAAGYLVPIFAAFATHYPGIDFQIDLSPRPVDLIAEGFDVAVRVGHLPDSQLHVRRLGAAPHGLFAAPSYLASAGAPTTPADLGGHACLCLFRPDGPQTRWHLRPAQSSARAREIVGREDTPPIEVAVKGRFLVNNVRFAMQLACEGMGVAQLDVALASAEVAAGRLTRVLPAWEPPPVPIHALTPTKNVPAKTRIFLDCVADHVEGLGRRPSVQAARKKR